MRVYMVEGDVVSPSKGETARPLEPQAIFCAGGMAHHSTWVKLTAPMIRRRLDGLVHDPEIADVELRRALLLIERHEDWQRAVLKSKGHWAAMKAALNAVRREQRLKEKAVAQGEAA